jgi:hypothetical protein
MGRIPLLKSSSRLAACVAERWPHGSAASLKEGRSEASGWGARVGRRAQGAQYNSGADQRIIKMQDMPVDPMEPPKFRHKKARRFPPASPPGPAGPPGRSLWLSHARVGEERLDADGALVPPGPGAALLAQRAPQTLRARVARRAPARRRRACAGRESSLGCVLQLQRCAAQRSAQAACCSLPQREHARRVGRLRPCPLS